MEPDEVPFCLLYELARESAAVEKLVQQWREWSRQAEAWNQTHGRKSERGQWIVPDGKRFDPTGEKQRPIHEAAAKFIPKINYPFSNDALPILILAFGRNE
ncbi:MAG: hypothetical protein ACKODH_09260 [Limisphaerales bacterium]